MMMMMTLVALTAALLAFFEIPVYRILAICLNINSRSVLYRGSSCCCCCCGGGNIVRIPCIEMGLNISFLYFRVVWKLSFAVLVVSCPLLVFSPITFHHLLVKIQIFHLRVAGLDDIRARVLGTLLHTWQVMWKLFTFLEASPYCSSSSCFLPYGTYYPFHHSSHGMKEECEWIPH